MKNPKLNAAVGIAKCPVTGKIYGVRVEEKADKKWWATWAFPIRPEVARREGYTENQFPPDILYEKEYPGCPYCKKHENLAEITKPPERKKQIPKICVSSPGCDDIGDILDSLNVRHKSFESRGYTCDILFLNCLTDDYIDPDELRSFVEKGGCLYASCYMDEIIDQAFPGLFDFAGHNGKPMKEMKVDVVDKELLEYVGQQISVEFDTQWAMLNSARGDVILRASSDNKSKYANKPIMVKVKYGRGLIFFTSFHNHAQASEKEKALLQLLLLKQFGSNSNSSILDASSELGVNIDEIKSKFKFNF